MPFKYIKVKTKGQIEGEDLLAPKLRFKEFDNNWNLVTLKSLMDFKNGINAPKDAYGKGIKYISVTDILNNNFITYEKIKGLVDIDSTTLENNSVTYGDVLFQRSSETIEDIGRSNVYLDANKMATFGGFVIRGKKKGAYNPLFINYLLQNNSSRKSIIVKGAGAQHYNISQEELEKIKVYFTTMAEQEKIGYFLSLLDKKIELQQRKIEALKIYKKGLINKLLNSNDTLNWKHIKLNDILLPGSKEKVLDTSKFQKINIKLNLKGLFKNNSNREMADTRPFYIRNVNEIIIGKQNYFNGSIAIVTDDFDGCICSNAIMSFSIKNDNPKFIYYYISQPNYIKKRAFLANGTGQKELSEKEFLNFEIYLPSIEEQNYIVNILDFVESKFNIENSKYEDLKLMKKSLLQQMFI